MAKDMPANNGRVTAGTHDRLIFNDHGESVRAMGLEVNRFRPRPMVRVQCTSNGQTVEVELGKREVQAFIMQLATTAGLACMLADGAGKMDINTSQLRKVVPSIPRTVAIARHKEDGSPYTERETFDAAQPHAVAFSPPGKPTGNGL